MVVELKHKYNPFRETLEEHSDIIGVELTLRNGNRYVLSDDDGKLSLERIDGLDRTRMGFFTVEHISSPPRLRELRPLEDE
jgi:hypothetical protein